MKTSKNPPAVDIRKAAYTMAAEDETAAEITLYGDIYEQRPVDYWTGEAVPGEFILLDEFMEDLKQVENCKDLTVRICSYGGDAGVSNIIHNRLRELSRNGTKLTGIVDGYAMSGGSLIMCSCDTVKVNPSSLIMIHKSWSFVFGGYNADELKELAEQNNAWDKMQVAIYKRKTGLSETVLMHMMSDTTYMTGQEAIEKGFADELLEDAEPLDIAASADGRCLYVRGKKMHLTSGMFAPDNIPTVTPEADAPAGTYNKPAVTGKGGNSMNLEELRAKYPELVAQIEAEARANGAPDASSTTPDTADSPSGDDLVSAERRRIQEIDAMAGLFDAETIREAKYGEHACTAQEMAYRAAMKAAASGGKFLAALEADNSASGAQDVESSCNNDPQNADEESPQAMAEQAKRDVAAYLKMKEGK